MIIAAGPISYLKKRALCMDIYPVRVRFKPHPVYIDKRGDSTNNFYYGSANVPIVNEMLGNDETTNDYLSSLPDEIQQEINQHKENFYSAEELHQFAEDLMKKS